MASPRRTYVVSLYDGDKSVVVEAVQRDERARLDDLDRLPDRIREWEDEDRAPSRRDELELKPRAAGEEATSA